MSWLAFGGDVDYGFGFGGEVVFGDDAPGTPGNPINLDAVNLDIPLGDPGNLASTIDAAPAAIANDVSSALGGGGDGGGFDPTVLIVGGLAVAGLIGLLLLLPHKAVAAVAAAGAAAP